MGSSHQEAQQSQPEDLEQRLSRLEAKLEMVRRAPPPLPQSYGMAERFLRIDRQTIEPQAARIVAVPRDAAEPAQCPLRVSPMPPRATADVDREQAAVANDRTAPTADDPVAVSIDLQGSCCAVDQT